MFLRQNNKKKLWSITLLWNHLDLSTYKLISNNWILWIIFTFISRASVFMWTLISFSFMSSFLYNIRLSSVILTSLLFTLPWFDCFLNSWERELLWLEPWLVKCHSSTEVAHSTEQGDVHIVCVGDYKSMHTNNLIRSDSCLLQMGSNFKSAIWQYLQRHIVPW